MPTNVTLFKWALIAGAVYFLAVSAVHFVGIKIPMLFIYYDIPSNAFQDKIISFLSFGWSVFFFTASKDPARQLVLTKGILYAGAVAILALSVINFSTDFKALEANSNPYIYWVETGILFTYLVLLVGLGIRLFKDQKD